MNDFVEECRCEWRRLRVPDPVANEMAADLAADLREAEAEGVSAEEVLGSGAFDPRSFAASWAAERGVSQPPAPSRERLPKRSVILAAVAAFVAITLSGAGLVTFASPSGAVSIRPSRPPSAVAPPALHPHVSGIDTRMVGSVLLIVGLAGIVASTLVWLSLGRGRLSPRYAYIDDRSTGPAY